MDPWPEGKAIGYREGAFGIPYGKTAHGLVRRSERYAVPPPRGFQIVCRLELRGRAITIQRPHLHRKLAALGTRRPRPGSEDDTGA